MIIEKGTRTRKRERQKVQKHIQQFIMKANLRKHKHIHIINVNNDAKTINISIISKKKNMHGKH